MTLEERDEAIKSLVSHYGLPLLLEEVDAIVDNVRNGVLSVPLDIDPEKAQLKLYAARMTLEGAVAVRNALHGKVKAIKERR